MKGRYWTIISRLKFVCVATRDKMIWYETQPFNMDNEKKLGAVAQCVRVLFFEMKVR